MLKLFQDCKSLLAALNRHEDMVVKCCSDDVAADARFAKNLGEGGSKADG